jgi:hypothetical protein
MAFFTPWFIFTEVSFLGHINDTPLHPINAVVWDSVDG